VDQTVAGIVEQKLRELYAPAAGRNHATAQTRFNDAAESFVSAANTVDVEAPATDIVNAPDDQRQAWTAAEQLAAALDTALPILTVAAQLANAHIDDNDGSALTLCVSPLDMGRRALWQAWETTDGRTRRWGALAKLGAKIRAANLSDIVAYRRPQPIETRLQPVPGQYGIYDNITVDPEAPGYQPAEPEQVMIPGKRLTSRWV
jgi:hypothetical protein